MSLAELEKRLQAIEDLKAIKKLHQNYINLMGEIRYDAVIDFFTNNAAEEVRNSGVKRGAYDVIYGS